MSPWGLLQAEQTQLSQPFHREKVLEPSNYFQVYVFRALSSAELDTALHVGSHQGGEEGQNPLPRPAAHTASDAAQDTVGSLGCKHTLLGRVRLFIHQYAQFWSKLKTIQKNT